MKISTISMATAYWAQSDRPVEDKLLSQIGAIRLPETLQVRHLSARLVEIGLTDGELVCRYDRGLEVVADFWAPTRLGSAEAEALSRSVLAQWSDGLGEGGLEVHAPCGNIEVRPSDVSLEIAQVDDGKFVAAPSAAVLAVRRGDYSALKAGLASGWDVDSRLAGYTALYAAIRKGRLDLCLALLAFGADPSAKDPDGTSPLCMCAVATALKDADAAQVAQDLLSRGVRPEPDVEELARLREKPLLASVLAEKGGGSGLSSGE